MIGELATADNASADNASAPSAPPRPAPLTARVLARAAPTGVPALAAVITGLAGIGHRQLWRDEHSTWWASTLSGPDFLRLLHNVDATLAPYYLFMHAWIAIVGDSAVALRLPSVAAMAVAAALTAALGCRLYDTGTGLVAGLLFAAVPAVARYSQEARPYAITMAATAAAALLLLRALDRPATRSRWIWYALAVTAIGWSHVVALCVLPAYLLAAGLAAPGSGGDRRAATPGRAQPEPGFGGGGHAPSSSVRRWAVATAAGLVPVAPLALAGSRQTQQIDWIRITWTDLPTLPTALFQSALVGGLLVGLAVLGFFAGRRPAALLGAWAIVPPVVLYATSSQLNFFYFRYLLFTLPAWVLLAAAGVRLAAAAVRSAASNGGPPAASGGLPAASGGPPAAVGRTPAASRRGLLAASRRGLPAVAVAVLCATVALGIPGQVEARGNPAVDEPDYQAAAALVRSGSRPGDAIAYGGRANGGTRGLRRAMAYELRSTRPPRDVFLAVTQQANGNFVGIECTDPAPCLGGTDRLWVLTTSRSTDPLTEMPRARADLLRERYTVAQRWRLTRIQVALLESRQPT